MYQILMALDDSTDHAHAQSNAIIDMPNASENITVILLHVFTDNVSGASIRQLEAAREAKQLLVDASVDVTLDETSGDPTTRVLEYAREHDVDLICLGGRKRSPTGKALFGSVAQDILLSADLPVLVCGDEPR